MHGSNPIRPQTGPDDDGQKLWIQEVFYTLQGEGPLTGQPAVFVRTAGCNLRCFWCDTDFESSRETLALPALLTRIDDLRAPACDLVVLTGGEPLRQNVVPLIDALLERGLRVQIETSGSLSLPLPVHPRLTVVCSPKTTRLHPALLPRIDVFKYVVAAGETDPVDGLPTTSTQKPDSDDRLFRPPAGARVQVMPRDDGDPARNQANLQAAVSAALAHGYTLTLQTHKLLGLR